MKKIAIIGGGASGLMAAISAARSGASVTIYEQKDKAGKKILATGNGRCNLTNLKMGPEYFRGGNPAFIENVLQTFGTKDTMDFFGELGVLLKDRDGYVYPITDQAVTILDALMIEVKRQNVTLITGKSVKEIKKQEQGFIVKTDLKKEKYDAVILSTGGKANPALGSDGKGYELAEELGHEIETVCPALVQLVGDWKFYKKLAGVRTHAKVTLLVDKQVICEDTGEVQFTDYGISGIPVFQISRYASLALDNLQTVYVEVDMLPTMSDEEFKSFMENRRKLRGEDIAEDFFNGILHKKITSFLLHACGIRADIRAVDIEAHRWRCFLATVKHFMVRVEDTKGFENAQVCCGGINLDEINVATMESKCCPGLYLCGEIMDVDGMCGGYNLQWAWSTGAIAGKHAAKD